MRYNLHIRKWTHFKLQFDEFWKCIHWCNHHYNQYIEHFHHLKNLSHDPLQPVSLLPWPQATIDRSLFISLCSGLEFSVERSFAKFIHKYFMFFCYCKWNFFKFKSLIWLLQVHRNILYLHLVLISCYLPKFTYF